MISARLSSNQRSPGPCFWKYGLTGVYRHARLESVFSSLASHFSIIFISHSLEVSTLPLSCLPRL